MSKPSVWVFVVLCWILAPVLSEAQSGNLDHRFGSHGIYQAPMINRPYDSARFVATYPASSANAGKVIILGDGNEEGKTQYVTTLLRINANGTMDTTFGTNGIAKVYFGAGTSNFSQAVLIQDDDKIMVVGRHQITTYPYGQLAMARFNANGTLDTTFGSSGKYVGFVNSNGIYSCGMARQKDGKYVVVGTGMPDGSYVVRVASDGSTAECFSFDMNAYVGGGGTYEYLNGVTLDDGVSGAQCIYATGTVQLTNNGVYRATAIKLNSNGTAAWKKAFDFDATNPGSAGSDIKFHDFGGTIGKKLVIGGGQGSTVYCNFKSYGVALLNTDGSFYTSFGASGIANVNINNSTSMERVLIQSDHKILIGGSTNNGLGLARLNTNGTLDTTFSDDGKTTYTYPNYNGIGQEYTLDSDGDIFQCYRTYTSSGSEYYFTAVKFHGFDKAMEYVRTDTDNTQTVASVKAGGSALALQVRLCIDGSLSPLDATSLTFSTAGSTSSADIGSVQVYYTGSSSTYSAATPFGSPATVSGGTITVSGTQALAHGENYFWLVFNAASDATPDHVMKAACTSVTVGGAAKTVTGSAVGATTILAPYYEYIYSDDDSMDYLTHVSFANIDNASGSGTDYGNHYPDLGWVGYSDFTAQVANVSRGKTYTFSGTLNPGSYWPDYLSAVIVWCDWNHDYDFDDPNEGFIVTNTAVATGPFTLDIPIPADAKIGETRMRVVSAYPDWFAPDPIPNINDIFCGEAEDYTLNISASVSKSTPSITAWPAASAITYGQKLSDSILSGGTASVEGAFAFDAPATAPAVGKASFAATFTPHRHRQLQRRLRHH